VPHAASRRAVAIAGVAALLAVGSCGNGLPSDLVRHLAKRGLSVRVLHSEAPISSREGLVLIAPDPVLEAGIIREFGLERVEPDGSSGRYVATKLSAAPVAIWGLAGRPASLRLGNGAGFEYLFLVKTATGRTYLVAAYAYG
jgi:hypothetical protein